MRQPRRQQGRLHKRQRIKSDEERQIKPSPGSLNSVSVPNSRKGCQKGRQVAVTRPLSPQEGVPTLKDHFGRKDFLPVEPQGCLSFLILLGEPRFV